MSDATHCINDPLLPPALDRIEHGERSKIQGMYVKYIVQKCHGLRAATLKSTKLNLNGATTSPISPLLRS